MTPPTPPTPPPSAPSPAAEADKRASFEREALVHLDSLYRVALRLTGNPAEADDLVQETMLRAYRARDRFEPGTSIRAWTTTILRRVFLTGAINAKRRGLQNDTDAGRPLDVARSRVQPPSDEPLDVRSLGEELEDAVKQALDRVPEVYRTSFFLSVVRRLSCEEIGEQLRVPAGTVMSRIHRARERLRGDLDRHRDALRSEDSPLFRGTRSRAAASA